MVTIDDDIDDLARRICPSDPLDSGIARAVGVLVGAGVETFESCEGGEGHSSAAPVVKFYGSNAAGWAALAACLDHDLPVSELARVWDLDAAEPSGPYWKLVFARKLT